MDEQMEGLWHRLMPPYGGGHNKSRISASDDSSQKQLLSAKNRPVSSHVCRNLLAQAQHSSC